VVVQVMIMLAECWHKHRIQGLFGMGGWGKGGGGGGDTGGQGDSVSDYAGDSGVNSSTGRRSWSSQSRPELQLFLQPPAAD